MGQEIACQARYDGQLFNGKAYLEGDAVVFRGDFRVRVPLTGARVTSEGGWLSVNGLELELKEKADDWARRILHPKSLAEKLGLKPGLRVGSVGISADFLPELCEDKLDLLFCQVETATDLESLKARLGPRGAIWLISPKGTAGVREAARAAGLIDTKVVSYSSTHTALRVTPRSAASPPTGPASPG